MSIITLSDPEQPPPGLDPQTEEDFVALVGTNQKPAHCKSTNMKL